MQEWYKNSGLKLHEAYRMADLDFDGEMNQKDLERFLREVVKVPNEEINPQRLDRLYKIMDVFKRGKLQISDFKAAVEESSEAPLNSTISGGRNLAGRNNFDWKLHARQQLGMAIRKHFNTLEDAFAAIAHQQPKMTLKQLTGWIDSIQALQGFNLTDKLIQTLFADLDPHKKGYLTQTDWENAFGGYNFGAQIKTEVQECFYSHFTSVSECFNYLVDQDKTPNLKQVTKHGLSIGLNFLLPKRFNQLDITRLWNLICPNPDTDSITFEQFSKAFGGSGYRGPKNNLSRRASSQSQSQLIGKANSMSQKGVTFFEAKRPDKYSSQKEVEDKVRKILYAAKIPFEEFYKHVETDKNGNISNLEFINAMRKLNLGLKQKELDALILGFEGEQTGKIKFTEVMKKFQPEENDLRIFQRTKEKLKKIKEQIYTYLISPKDAFYQFNENHTGKLTYGQFCKLMNTVSVLAREDAPSFSVLKDIFDFIDIRKDGTIDLMEWMQSFRMIENDDKLPATLFRSSTQLALLTHRSLSNPRNSTPQKTRRDLGELDANNRLVKTEKLNRQASIRNSLSQWESSKQYEEVLRCIGRNRKILGQEFGDLTKLGQPITVDVIKFYIGRVLRKNGLNVDEEFWPYLVNFAIKDGVVDYKFLLERFKERAHVLTAFPSTVDPVHI